MKFDVQAEPGMNFELGLLFGAMRASRIEWLGELGEPSAEAILWQTSGSQHSIGGCLCHLIGCEQFWLRQVVRGQEADGTNPAVEYDLRLRQLEGYWPAPPAQPFEWYKKLLDDSLEKCAELLQSLDDPNEVFPFHGDELTLRWIVSHVLEHGAYTGGQAVLLNECWKTSSG